MSEKVIPVQQFDAEYKVVGVDGKPKWLPCTVVGVTYDGRWSDSRFITIITGTDGLFYPYSVDAVRHPEHQPLRHIAA